MIPSIFKVTITSRDMEMALTRVCVCVFVCYLLRVREVTRAGIATTCSSVPWPAASRKRMRLDGPVAPV